MKTLLLQRFARCQPNAQPYGTLWEERCKSVIVESGIAALCAPGWLRIRRNTGGSSYGEAVDGRLKGNGKKAREGLVRACTSHHGVDPERTASPSIRFFSDS